ncbi:MAG: ExeA family protein [Vicinamibacterales bacterium]
MYERYYGLQERPFDLSPNPRFLCFTPQHKEALVHLQYGLSGRPGITMLVGEAGTGKTTLVRAALQASAGQSTIVHLSNPTLTRDEFFEYLAGGYGFSRQAGHSKVHFLRELEHALIDATGTRHVLALVVDEAQSVPYELLEEIRLLTNAEAASGRSLAVALVGQPELAGRLDEPGLRQLKQRVVLRCELTPLSLKDTAAYIAGRVKTAGGDATRLFSRDAVVAIHERSKGIPRIISVICDNALVNGFASDQRPVGAATIAEVCKSLSLDVAPAAASPESPFMREPAAAGRAPMFAGFTRARRFSFF